MKVLACARQFLRRTLADKGRSVSTLVKRLFPGKPLFFRLPFGDLWILRDNAIGDSLLNGGFEDPERHFVERFVKRGMTVLDLGAHHGLYTLLAAKRVGAEGKVIAFEPSARERRALRLHALLNRRFNISIQSVAVGHIEGEIDLHVAHARDSGCNSLRSPAADVGPELSRQRVRTVRLDEWLGQANVGKIDFIKLDVEGGELDALRGAGRLLEERPRPLILAEVQDVRTKPWGYFAREIIRYLENREYEWFSFGEDGSPVELDVKRDDYEGNFLACPKESLPLLLSKFKGDF
jgi:FkbM family methyltransferase